MTAPMLNSDPQTTRDVFSSEHSLTLTVNPGDTRSSVLPAEVAR